MRLVLSLAHNDLFSLRRDPLLIYLAAVPWLMVLLVRLTVPGLTVWLHVILTQEPTGPQEACAGRLTAPRDQTRLIRSVFLVR